MQENKIRQNYTQAVLYGSDEPLPDTFYIFTNANNWPTYHNLKFTNGFTSGSIGEILASEDLQKKYIDGTINYFQYTPNDTPDVYGLSAYGVNATLEYRIEYNCESHRRIHEDTKLLPSRLSAIYAFGDYESCQQVSKIHGWPIESVRKFKLLNLPLTRVAKVNMEIISLMRYAERQGTWRREEQAKIWRHYWTGGGNLDLEIPTDGKAHERISSGVIWEYLIEGRVELIETNEQ